GPPWKVVRTRRKHSRTASARSAEAAVASAAVDVDRPEIGRCRDHGADDRGVEPVECALTLHRAATANVQSHRWDLERQIMQFEVPRVLPPFGDRARDHCDMSWVRAQQA